MTSRPGRTPMAKWRPPCVQASVDVFHGRSQGGAGGPRSAKMQPMRRPTQDAVLFDLDDVLVDSRAAISGCINHALARNGFPEHAEPALHRFIGPPLPFTFAELTD